MDFFQSVKTSVQVNAVPKLTVSLYNKKSSEGPIDARIVLSWVSAYRKLMCTYEPGK